MPSGFVEVSGYSKSDLDAAYARGLAEGGSAVKGNATAAQVLQGYTFSSASAGSNKSGTMVNRGSVSQQLNPGSSFSGASGYYSNINIQANTNTQSRVMTNSYEDLGASNLIRYVDARNIVSAARQSGYNDGKSDGFDDFVTNAGIEYADITYGSGYPAMGEAVVVWNSKNIPKDSIIIFNWSTAIVHSSSKVAQPLVVCTATTGSVERIREISYNYDNWTISGDVKCDLRTGAYLYKVLEASAVHLEFSFTGGNYTRGHIAYDAAIMKSSTS